MSKQQYSEKESSKNYASVIILLLTLAVVAATSAWMLYTSTVKRLHRKKWQDYDDCGLA